DIQGIQDTPAFQRIARGPTHSCAISTDEELYCWGSNADKQLDDGTAEPRTSPQEILLTIEGEGLELQDVYTGPKNTCVTLIHPNQNGAQLYCWGDNSAGQLASEAASRTATPHHFSTLAE